MAPHPSLDVALNMALAIVASSTAPLLLLDKDLQVLAASASFCASFEIDPATATGRRLAELGAGEWNVPQLMSLLNATASGFAQVEAYEMDLRRPSRVARCLVLNANKLAFVGQDETRLLLSVSDVTNARLAETIRDDLLRDKDVLLQELHHRVANSLQIIASVLMQSARKVQSEETRGHLVNAHQRLMSVAALQQQLAVSKPGEVKLKPYFTALCESIGASMIRDPASLSLTVTADDSITQADTSVSLGLIVTELVINALKHAFPDNRGGIINVGYHSKGPNWTLSVDDDGVGMPQNPTGAKAGLGTSIVQALSRQLGANIVVSDRQPGTKVSIVHAFVPVLVGQTVPPAIRAV